MITLLPEPGAYGATVVTGPIDTKAERLRGVVVLKAAYNLVPNGAEPLQPQLAAGKAPHAIRMADQGVPKVENGKTVGFTLQVEADIALEKDRSDIVVEGWVVADQGGTLQVNGVTWMTRAAGAPVVGDAGQHLFGWHGRNEDKRALGATGWTPTLPADLLPPDYTARFNNFHRRSPGFSGVIANTPLPKGGTVQIHRKADQSDVPYRFFLPTEAFSARLRTCSGHCPDRPTRWAIADVVPLVPDTLIINPAANRASVIWRGGWDWAQYPTDSYRAVEILREEA
jgi:hypothetical protein